MVKGIARRAAMGSAPESRITLPRDVLQRDAARCWEEAPYPGWRIVLLPPACLSPICVVVSLPLPRCARTPSVAGATGVSRWLLVLRVRSFARAQ